MKSAIFIIAIVLSGCSVQVGVKAGAPLDGKYLNDEKLLNAVIKIESSYDERAFNKSSGAVGLMQLTPVIYKNLCGLTKEEAFERDRNIACGDLYLHILMKKYNGNLEKALIFYNNGYVVKNPGYANKVMKEGSNG